jgi:hypothetical protein
MFTIYFIFNESCIAKWRLCSLNMKIHRNCLSAYRILVTILKKMRHAVSQVVEAMRYKPEGRGFDSLWCHRNFPLTIFPVALWPWSRLNLEQKWVLGIFLGGKDGRCVGWKTYHLHVPIFLKSGSLNLLEPSWPEQACNWIALFLCKCPRKSLLERGKPQNTMSQLSVT